jgi:hypothetical protein
LFTCYLHDFVVMLGPYKHVFKDAVCRRAASGCGCCVSSICSTRCVDVALLQEAVPPPEGATYQTIPAAAERWATAGGDRRFCAAIARLSDRVSLRPIQTNSLADANRDERGVSLPGTLAAGEVTNEAGEQHHGGVNLRRVDVADPLGGGALDLRRCLGAPAHF